MFIFARLMIAAAIGTFGASPAGAAPRIAYPPVRVVAAVSRPTQSIVSVKAELADDVSSEAIEIALLAAAQSALEESSAHSAFVRDSVAALNDKATALRREAYGISNQAGLSATQNHKAIAAMDAADDAEAAAGFAQSDETAAAAALMQARNTRDQLAINVMALSARVGACTRTIELEEKVKQSAR
jgi:hypothetical protein